MSAKTKYVTPAMVVYSFATEDHLLAGSGDPSISVDPGKDYDDGEVTQRSMERTWDEE